jgi:hypothetical protein
MNRNEDFDMQRNIGDTDRIIRVLLAMVVMGAGFYYHSWWGLVGLVILATATFKWCPPYALLGINTCDTGCKEDMEQKAH